MQCQQIDTSDIDVKQFISRENNYQTMSTDNDSDDDLELLKTLSQLHGIINTTQSSDETNQIKSQLSLYASSINQERNTSDFSSENIIKNRNETELLDKKSQNSKNIIPSSPAVIDTIIKTDDEEEEKTKKKNVIFYKNLNDDVGKQKEKYERGEEKKKSTPFSSLTSSTSPILFNDDSHSTVVIVDPDASSSLPNLLLLSNELNGSTSFSNQLITDDLQISNTKSNMSNLPKDDLTEQTTSNLFDPYAPTTTTTTTTGMVNDIFVNSKDADVKEFGMRPDFLPSNSTPTQPLANYNFDKYIYMECIFK